MSDVASADRDAPWCAGCARIFAEKISGAYSDRPQLAKAIAALGEGDTLVVCKLDRLARSTRDLLNTLDAIGKARQAFARSRISGRIRLRHMGD